MATSTTSITSHGAKVPVGTTFTSSSKTCVATLQGVVLDNGSTGLVGNTAGSGYITLNQTCFSGTARPETETAKAKITTIRTTVYQSQSPTSGSQAHDHHNALSSGVIAGIVLAIVSVLAVVLSVVGLLWWRRRRQRLLIATTMPRKDLDDDPSDEISLRWEKDGDEIKEMSSDKDPVEKASTERRSLDVTDLNVEPVEIGYARSIQIPDDSPVTEPLVSPL